MIFINIHILITNNILKMQCIWNLGGLYSPVLTENINRDIVNILKKWNEIIINIRFYVRYLIIWFYFLSS